MANMYFINLRKLLVILMNKHKVFKVDYSIIKAVCTTPAPHTNALLLPPVPEYSSATDITIYIQ